jgi:hypothetical protein
MCHFSGLEWGIAGYLVGEKGFVMTESANH